MQKLNFLKPILLIGMLFLASTIALPNAVAHPEDEFCQEDTGMDPELCRELAKLDSQRSSDAYASFGNTELEPIELDRPFIETLGLYVKLGFIHIVPKGYDHILFVLALFLASTAFRPLLIQVSAFTVAHTITLAMAATGLVSVPANIVEPLIALSIAYVAVENIFFRDLTKWRPFVIFGFGLFHGLGFAGVLSELGLVKSQFITSLIGFNIGVEFGQLFVIAVAAVISIGLMRILPEGQKEQLYKKYVIWGGSGIIAFFGLFWFFSRILS